MKGSDGGQKETTILGLKNLKTKHICSLGKPLSELDKLGCKVTASLRTLPFH